MKKLLVVMGLALVCGLSGNSDEPKDGALRCEMKLSNGSLIKGELKGLDKVNLKTRHGVLTFKIADLRSVAWGSVKKEEQDTLVASDGTYKGWMEDTGDLTVDTGFGVLKVPTAAIKSVRIVHSGKSLGADFDSGDLDDWTKFGTSQWSIVDGKLQGSPSGTYDSIQYNEILEGTYTIEVEMTNANNAGILWNAQDGINATALWMSPGNVRVFSGQGTWYNQQVASWSANYAWNATTKVKIEVDGGKAVVYVGEKRLGEVNAGSGGGRVGFFCFGSVTSYDNFVITR